MMKEDTICVTVCNERNGWWIKEPKFHSECVGVRGMMNNNLEATWCGVRDEISFYKLSESASRARHSICGFKAIHIDVKTAKALINNQFDQIFNG